MLTPAARAAGRENLARLLVGSEGTLAFSTALTLKLAPIKPRKVVGICQFPSFREAMRATQRLVALDPEAVELIDSTMIALGLSIPIYRPTIERMLIGQPGSLLLVEFHGEEDAAARPPSSTRSRRRWAISATRMRSSARRIPASRPRSPRCARPGSTS